MGTCGRARIVAAFAILFAGMDEGSDVGVLAAVVPSGASADVALLSASVDSVPFD